MSRFRTLVPQEKSPWRIAHRDSILLLGSCFAERIGEKLLASKFPSLTNPLGIAYNPFSLARLLSYQVGLIQAPISVDYAEHLGLWHSFDLHSSFSASQRLDFDRRWESALALAKETWKDTEILVLTWGTAHAFFKKQGAHLVNNCHKYPSTLFHQSRLSPAQIISQYNPLLEQLFREKPNLRVVLTISPVRHIRLGIHENQLSKASLLLAADQLVKQFKRVEYFPAYELLLDDLRDYRFYGDDLIHPSELGVNYIWDHFSEKYFSEATQDLIKRWGKAVQGMTHRPRFPGSQKHLNFLEKLHQQLLQINESLDCANELEDIAARIAKYRP